MTMSKPKNFNFTTVLMNPTKYKDGVVAGFIVYPTDDDAPDGWGEPYFEENEDGTTGGPIWPGTKDGPNTGRAVGYTSDKVWKMRRSRFFQVAGAIDWWGPWTNPIKKKKRTVISVNGPTSRYFNWDGEGAFVYDDNPENCEVYSGGKLLAITPHPVLGAARATWKKPKSDGSGTENTHVLIVICKDGDKDVAYWRPYSVGMAYDMLTDDLRASMAALYQTYTHPNGWNTVATFKGINDQANESYPSDTPWFFNEEGTAARCMKRIKRKWTDEFEVEREQDSYYEGMFTFKPSTGGGSFTYSDDVDNKFTYTETIKKIHAPWTNPDTSDTWMEDHVTASTNCIGKQKVAVDWDPELAAWTYAYFDVNDNRAILRNFETSDGGNLTGVAYPAGNNGPDNHVSMPWFGITESRTLLMGPKVDAPVLKFYLGYGRSGSKTFRDSGTVNMQDDPWFYFWDSLDVFLHHLDLRTYLISGRVRWDSLVLVQDGPNTGYCQHFYEDIEWAAVKPEWVWDKKAFFSRYTSEVSTVCASWELFIWTYSEKATWPLTINKTWSVKDYQGENSPHNDEGDEFVPTLISYLRPSIMKKFENTYLRRWKMDDYLRHKDHCSRNGVWASAENNTHLVNWEFLNPGSKEIEYAGRLYPYEAYLATLCYGGERFWGGGTM